MPTTKTKVALALKDLSVLSFSEEHQAKHDVWVVDIKEEGVSFVSNKYGISLNVQYDMLPDCRGAEKLRKEIEMRLVFFIKGLEAGVDLSRQEIAKSLSGLFMQYLENVPKEEETQQ